MAKRVTIMMEDSTDKKIRLYQAKMMQKHNKAYSYSKAVNDILKKAV